MALSSTPDEGGRSPAPLVVTVVVAAVSLGALLLACWQGWLGPDVDRGGSFCEADRGGLLKQPVNALSNLAFVVAGIAIARRAGQERGQLARPHLATVMAVVVTLLGPASMAMHASESALGGRLDMLSMYLIASFTMSYALMRVLGRGAATATVVFSVLVLLCEVVAASFGSVPVVGHAGNAIFGALLVSTLVLEASLIPRVRRDNRWGWAAVGAMLLAFGIWTLSHDGGLLCDPTALVQGHGVWHVLCAVAAYCIYRLYASERAL